ncbi:MAG: XRE family transcriptional regulator [Bacteroidaceae bacterium]|nr:XRE family transcriptional regulator [Bacteroidaceae bacterium]
MTGLHIGKLIEKRFRAQGRSVSWFAQKLSCHRTNVYDIFARSDIDTLLLRRISEILEYDFFSELSEDFKNNHKALPTL